MNSKKNKRLLAVFFSINIVLVGVYGYFIYAVETKNKETAVLYAAFHQAASDREKIQGFERVLKDTEKDRNQLSAYFITKTNEVTFIERIEKIGKSAGVALSVNSVSDKTKDSGAVELNFSTSGKFSDIYRLMALIESMPYKVTLKKADIRKAMVVGGAGSEWKGDFTVALESVVAVNTKVAPPEVLAHTDKK